MVKRYNITIGRKYEKDGEEKTAWSTVGKLVWFQGSEGKEDGFKIELPIFGHDRFKVFEESTKEGQNGARRASKPKDGSDIGYPTADEPGAENTQKEPGVESDSIPF